MKVSAFLIALGLLSAPGQLIDFDSVRPGGLPPGWTVPPPSEGHGPKWEVLKDTSAPSPPYVFGQLAPEKGQAPSPLAILEKPSFKDGEVSVRVKPVTGRDDRTGGLIWRYRDPGNYYLVCADAMRKNVVVYRIQNGVRTPLVPKGMSAARFATPHNIQANAWAILKVAFRGPAYAVYVNHRRVLQGTDSTFGTAGHVGLWTHAGSVTYFDDFRVNPR
jgi:hypothetical protein